MHHNTQNLQRYSRGLCNQSIFDFDCPENYYVICKKLSFNSK